MSAISKSGVSSTVVLRTRLKYDDGREPIVDASGKLHLMIRDVRLDGDRCRDESVLRVPEVIGLRVV